jgi:hypothetical protein
MAAATTVAVVVWIRKLRRVNALLDSEPIGFSGMIRSFSGYLGSLPIP